MPDGAAKIPWITLKDLCWWSRQLHCIEIEAPLAVGENPALAVEELVRRLERRVVEHPDEYDGWIALGNPHRWSERRRTDREEQC